MKVYNTQALLALCVACHHGAGSPAPAPQLQPNVELERALGIFRHGDFRRAQLLLQRLTFEFGPGQPELAQINYYLAECAFQLGEHAQAATDFRKVADEFPTTEYAPLALLRAGDANLRMWRRPELDPSYGETALAIYQELAGRYPDSEAAARAQLHVRQLKEWFAEKSYKAGMFYFRRRAYDSAIIYFKDVIAGYPGTPKVSDALLRLADSYRAIGYADELKETCAHLRRFFSRAGGVDRRCPRTPADSDAAS